MIDETTALVMAVLLGTIIIVIIFSRQNNEYKQHVDQLKPKGGKNQKVKELKVFTREEVAKHNTRDDAWVIITDKKTGEHQVFDITEYVDEHPGGESILKNIGGDATEGFFGPQHPDTVFVMVKEFLIGTLAN